MRRGPSSLVPRGRTHARWLRNEGAKAIPPLPAAGVPVRLRIGEPRPCSRPVHRPADRRVFEASDSGLALAASAVHRGRRAGAGAHQRPGRARISTTTEAVSSSFHGVNVVYKHAPYEVYPDPGKPWNFTAADASLDGPTGLQRGAVGCRLGRSRARNGDGQRPRNLHARHNRAIPDNSNRTLLQRYLSRLELTVNLLGRYHIYTILDMHQDVYNEMFDGEGAPRWAVCTDGVHPTDPPGRWSREYADARRPVRPTRTSGPTTWRETSRVNTTRCGVTSLLSSLTAPGFSGTTHSTNRSPGRS